MSQRQERNPKRAHDSDDQNLRQLSLKEPSDTAKPQNKAQQQNVKGGLDVEVHPLFRELAAVPTVTKKSRKSASTRDLFDATALNPYIDQKNFASSMSSHRRRPLQLNPKGKFIAEANQVRAQEQERLQKEKDEQERLQKGILPDANTQETLFRSAFPPLIEWWDMPYLRTRLYKAFFDESKDFYLDDEQAPISIYIQHPVPVPPPNDTIIEPKVYLTKDEIRRKRRNERQIKHKEKQDRIKLGLDPPPPPKVKLANLMNVLTDEAIKDPTSVERRVRQEIQDRYEKHMAENEARKPTPEQKQERVKQSQTSDLQKGLVTTVYKVKSLADGQHFFKVDMNAKQLGLFGIALINPRFCLVIAEGGAKSMKFFKKLMTRRIKWDQLASGEKLDNSCVEVWEGELKDLSFRKWSPMYTENDDEAYQVLKKFGHENYWREAFNL